MKRRAIAIFAATALAGPATLLAQSIEPRQFSNAPVGVNFLISGYAYTQGGVGVDPSLPIEKPELETSSGVLAYARSLDLWGKSGKIDCILPYTWLAGTAEADGQPLRRYVTGFADPVIRLSVNFYGAPALTPTEFSAYRQDLIVGAALQISAPLGQYDDSRLVNIGTNRWSFRPSIGVSKAVGPWTWEAIGAVTLYTDNGDFYRGRDRSQDPLYALEAHLIRSFKSGVWASVDANYYTGGATTVDGVYKRDMQRNWRVGGTVAMPVDRRNSIKLYASDGISARTGNNYTLVGIAWQYRWGGGL